MADDEQTDLSAGDAGREAAALDAEATARDAERAAPETDRARGRARRAAVVGLRVVTGLAGTAVALAVIVATGLLPLPSRSDAAPTTTVTPAAAPSCGSAPARSCTSATRRAATPDRRPRWVRPAVATARPTRR
ncbi:hypothetical protein GCM10025881_10310 [Pseudolysinimonas kribbensis]|uniref:Uncharacterized protein n=1 Tax=Pseudolysinimonas kribbensis TaxID=433641 RepID=A0ABQ6K2P9_9MICO|nr:hypothetical protein [Pseudolysinimonas kribbensis]GMA94207.1 hypothetical protein GCM10025881_10310 [Pseudolysinimonas kribbensis]